MSVTASSSQSHYASTFNLQVHNLYVTVVLTIAQSQQLVYLSQLGSQRVQSCENILQILGLVVNFYRDFPQSSSAECKY